MNRKRMIALLVAIAVFGFSANASSAQAAKNFLFGATSGSIGGAAGSEHLWKFAGGRSVFCPSAVFTGGFKAASASSQTVFPNWTKCKSSLAGNTIEATVFDGNCEFTFSFTGTTGAVNNGHTSLTCPPNADITIDVYNDAAHKELVCKYTTKAQGPIKGITYENLATTPPQITINANISGEISYERIAGSAGPCGPESGKASYTGPWIVAAFDPFGTAVSLKVG
jgi:hypothetical protein